MQYASGSAVGALVAAAPHAARPCSGAGRQGSAECGPGARFSCRSSGPAGDVNGAVFVSCCGSVSCHRRGPSDVPAVPPSSSLVSSPRAAASAVVWWRLATDGAGAARGPRVDVPAGRAVRRPARQVVRAVPSRAGL